MLKLLMVMFMFCSVSVVSVWVVVCRLSVVFLVILIFSICVGRFWCLRVFIIRFLMMMCFILCGEMFIDMCRLLWLLFCMNWIMCVILFMMKCSSFFESFVSVVILIRLGGVIGLWW